MNILRRFYVPFIFLIVIIEATDSDYNETSSNEGRQSRATGRIVKLYSGTRPEPILCSGEGFQKDPYNCAVFYRCMKSGNGKYTVFKFQCGPGTVYDPDTEVCNHPRSTKRSECGGFSTPTDDTSHLNEIESMNNEIPSPIITHQPIYIASTSTKPVITAIPPMLSNSPYSTTKREVTTPSSTSYPWGSTVSNIYIDNGAMVYPLKPTVTSSPLITMSSHGVYTTTPSTTSKIPHSNARDNICRSDGFMGDSENCRKFYRCVVNQKGGYTRYEFMCTETTVWDDDQQICNHAWAVKRSRCGYRNDKITNSNTHFAAENIHYEVKNDKKNNMGGNQSNSTTQQQLQISYGSKVTQTQTQISHAPVVNQTQIHYGDRINQGNDKNNHQNQTQIAHGSAVSQSQTQINYDNNGIQTQLQVDHSNKASQSQVQINESSTKKISTSASYVKSNTTNTQKNEGCTELGFIADANDCQKFYRCVDNGRGGYAKYEFSCSEGTVWDQNINACNHAWAVKECGSKVTGKPTSNIAVTSMTSTHKTTLKYHTTTSTTTSVNDQLIPEAENSQDNEDDGYQNPIVKPVYSSTSTTTTSPVINNAKKDGECSSSGFMGDKNDCKIFYRCVENEKGGYIKYEFKCGEGTLWDSEIGACNHAWAVKECGGAVKPDYSEPEAATEKHTTTSTSALISTTATPLTTSTKHYQTIPETVDTEENEDNGYQKPEQIPPSLSTSTTIKTTVDGIMSEACTSSGFMGDNKDCKIFYRCVENGNGGYTKYEFKCGEGTVWDAEIEACNHAWAVKKCGGNNITEMDTTTKKEPTATMTVPSTAAPHSTTQIASTSNFDNEDDMGYGPSHNDVLTTQKPPEPPQNVNQVNTVCKSNGFVGDKNNCKKFYRCVDNGQGGYISYEFTCSEGTVWDSKIDACNHEWAVEKCGGSTTISNIQETAGITTESNKAESTSTPHITTTTTSTTVTASVSTGNNDCTKSGFMGDSNNCKKFYRCVDNGKGSFIKYEYSCGEGTVWDQEIEACNHAWAVTTCGSSATSSIVSSSGAQHSTTPQSPPINDEIDNGYPTNVDKIPDQISSSTTEASKDSNQSSICTESGFIGDKNNCKKFYRCVDDGKGGFIRHEFSCGEGTVWDQSIEACNHAWAVKDCGNVGNTTQTPDNTNDSAISSTTTIATSVSQEYPQVTEGISNADKEHNAVCFKEGFMGDPNNCRIFYRCVDDGKGSFTKYEFTCGQGTYWSQEILSCDHITSDKECGEKGTATSPKPPEYEHDEPHIETTTSSKDEISSTQKPSVSPGVCTSDGFYGNQEDCKKFYRCVDNGDGSYTKYDFTCGEGTVWDQDLQTCNHQSGTCPGTSSSSSQTTVSQSQHGDGTTIPTTTEKKETLPTTTPVSSAVNCDSEAFFADPNDCRVFIRCVKDDKGGFTKYHFTCAEGTVWVQDILACDHDTGEEQCSAQTVPKPVTSGNHQQVSDKYEPSTTSNILGDEMDDKYNNSNTGASSSSNICSSEGYYGNQNDCRKFYRCVDNGNGGYTKYDFTCSEGTAWDSDIQACNHIEQVPSCKGSVLHDEENSPTTQSSSTSSQDSSATSTSSTTQKTTEVTKPNSDSSTEKTENTDTCDSEGFFGNTQDCKKFYRCVDDGNGGYTKYDFTCAEGTIWDQDVTTCNHPGDVVNPSCNKINDGSTTESSSSDNSQSSGSSSGTTDSSSSDNSQSSGSSSSTTESTTKGQKQDESSKKPDSNNNINCTKAGYYPNPNDCKKFYRCVDWDGDGTRFSVYHFECGEGTIWDPALETCNHEESVYPPRDCSGSQSQNENQSTTESTTTTTQKTSSESTTESTTSTTTEQSGEGTTAKPEKTTTEKQGESTTEQLSTTEKQGESTTDQQTESTTEKSNEGTTTEKANESTTQKQSETTTDKSSEGTTQQPAQNTTEQSSEGTTEQSGQSTTEQSSEGTTEQSQQSTTEKSSESTTEQTSEGTTEKSSESTTEQSSEGTTEKSGENTTEQSTEGTTEKEGTTEQTGGSTTEQTEGTTPEGSTTESSKSEQSTTEESSTEKSTTEQSMTEGSSTTESETETSTNENSGNKECPKTEEGEYLFVCPSSFRRHPKYCNLFYQCDENEETHEMKTAVFTCPNGTIYDESQTKCVEESKADKQCEGEIAQKRRFKRRNRIGENDLLAVNKDSYACPAAGYYAFEKDGDCSPGFLKCKTNKANKLKGFVYQCPEGYLFWSISRRCERVDRVRDCRRSVLNSWDKRWEIPIEIRNVAWA